MYQRFRMVAGFLVLFPAVFFLTSQARQARAEEGKDRGLAKIATVADRCLEVAKKAEVVVKMAEKAAKEAREAANELREKGTLEAAKKAAAAARKAENAAEQARIVAEEATAAECLEVAKKAEAAAKKAENAAKEAKGIIKETGETRGWPREVIESVFPIALDPETPEQELYQQERREEEVSPSQ